jgi:Uma2 family endonuclease
MAGQSTLEDLARADGWAELVDGAIVPVAPLGVKAEFAAAEIHSSLRAYARATRIGYAMTGRVPYVVNLPNRTTFSPTVSLHTGVHSGMKFLEGAPWFAVEVRSENDYGPKADAALRAKIADYFAAGTQVVWDVDVLALEVVRMYTVAEPKNASVFARGMNAHAEPALPSWAVLVDDLFPFDVPYSDEES